MSFQKFLQIILAAALVGLTEEILFRGMFFYALKDVLGKWIILWAVVISSFFAKTHFIKAEDLTSTVNWMSGWEMWRHVWPSWSQVPHIFMQYLNLFLMGLVLCALVWRMKSLWFAMGLHTGWVMIIQTIERNKNPLDEWQTMLFLIVMLAAILIKKHERLGAESR